MKDILGLLVLAWPLTLLILIGIAFLIVVPLAVRYAGKHGRSKWRWGIGAFLIVYFPIFWDWIPTVVAHKYYCEREAGFWVYKTLDQWKAENLGGMEGLVYYKDMPYVQAQNGVETALNQRFIHVHNYEGPFLFNRWRIETVIRDSKNGEVIAREIGFSTSQERRQAGWDGWKFWLDNERCSTENHRDQGSFDKIIAQFEGAKK